jgi:hypothetical protein
MEYLKDKYVQGKDDLIEPWAMQQAQSDDAINTERAKKDVEMHEEKVVFSAPKGIPTAQVVSSK